MPAARGWRLRDSGGPDVLCPERSVLRSSQSRPPPRGGGLWVFVGSPCSPFDRPVASSRARSRNDRQLTIARRRRVAADGDARGGVCGLCACAPVRTSGRSGACLNSSRCTTRSPARLPALRQVSTARRPGSALNVKDERSLHRLDSHSEPPSPVIRSNLVIITGIRATAPGRYKLNRPVTYSTNCAQSRLISPNVSLRRRRRDTSRTDAWAAGVP